MKDGFKKNILKKINITDDEFNQFYSLFKSMEFKNKELILKEGRICRYYFFISDGLTRTFYINDKGKEIITSFAIEEWWLTDIESFVHQKPSRMSIQALEPTTLLAISYENLEKAYIDIPAMNNFFRILTQNMVIAFQRRHDFYMNETGRHRYRLIVQSLPNFVQRIPQHMLASYLGITPEYLSELRKK